MITTNSRELWSRIWSIKDHGKSWEAVYERQHAQGFRWLHESFGTNLRMTEIQATIGRIQLRCMADWHARRIFNAECIWGCARQLSGLRVPMVPEKCVHAAYKCYVFINTRQLKSGWDRDRVRNEIISLGVPCYSGSCPEVYLERAFDNTGWRPAERFSTARELGETSLMFLVHPTLTSIEIDRTCTALTSVMAEASS